MSYAGMYVVANAVQPDPMLQMQGVLLAAGSSSVGGLGVKLTGCEVR